MGHESTLMTKSSAPSAGDANRLKHRSAVTATRSAYRIQIAVLPGAP